MLRNLEVRDLPLAVLADLLRGERLVRLRSTPLGEPVVPEVYWMLVGSPGNTGLAGRSRPFASMVSHSPVPKWMTCSSACPGARAWSRI